MILVWGFFSWGHKLNSTSVCKKKNCLRLVDSDIIRCRAWKLDLEEH